MSLSCTSTAARRAPKSRSLRPISALVAALMASTAAFVNAPMATAAGEELRITMRADLLDGVGADAEIRLNSKVLRTVRVSTTSYRDVVVALPRQLALKDRVDVRFTNDGVRKGKDRNLYVKQITSRGHVQAARDKTTVFDKGSTWASATDGRSVQPGARTMRWNGALRFVWTQGTAQKPSGVTGPVVLTGAASSTRTLEAKQRIGASTLPGKQVWGHFIGYGLPNWDKLNGGQYGESYYLDLVHGDERTRPRPTAGVPRAQAAGMTGMQVLQSTGGSGVDYLNEWFAGADPTWGNSRHDDDFSVAPVLAEPKGNDVVRMTKAYVRAASGHASAAKVDGKYLIYVYNSRYHLSPGDWAKARRELREQNVPVFIVADLCQDIVYHNWHVPADDIAPYLPYWDATWLWETDTQRIWPEVADLINRNKAEFAGGINPGYNRETPGGYTADAVGTRKLRNEWELGLAYGARWQNVVTWNDLIEDTQVQPTSNWNATRSDVNAFYSAKLRDLPFPRPRAELYVTTPKAIRLGDSVRAEAMLLNGGRTSAWVKTYLVDGTGKRVSEEITAGVTAGSSGDATTAATAVQSKPAKGFFRAVATSYNADGTVIQKVTSAPVVVYAANEKPTTDLRRTYYSVPARSALPDKVTLSLSGNPATRAAAATVSTAGGTQARFLEVLQNTRLARRGYDDTRLVAPVPMPKNVLVVGGQTVSTAASGYYVARVMDAAERVGYSDPVAVNP